MGIPRVATLDFESEAIEPRHTGLYPPKPVGFALHIPGDGPSRYYAWGHHVQNNCTMAEARERLRRVYNDWPILFHNEKFDREVAAVHLDLPLTPPRGTHDTKTLLYLNNPHARTFSLKPSAERELGELPTEQDELREWLIKNVPEAKRAKTKWGAYIARGPGKLVGKYAIGDVDRTRKLFKKFYPKLDEGMMCAYDVERELVPILIRWEERGVPVDKKRLSDDIERWEKSLFETDKWIRRRLRTPDLEVDKNEQLAQALWNNGRINKELWDSEEMRTPTGALSTNKDVMLAVLEDAPLLAVLRYRSKLTNGLRTFATPWLTMAMATGGKIHTEWLSVRGEEKGGTRTGRFSSKPNFQNVPRKPDQIIAGRVAKGGELRLPPDLFRVVAPLPHLRDYIVAEKCQKLINRDYSQQELRILAHFEGDKMLAEYMRNPRIDFHDMIRDLVNSQLNTNYERRTIKDMNFGITYGMGAGLLAEKIGDTVEVAKRLKRAIMLIFPGMRELDNELKECGRTNQPIRTWGGRLYYVEPPRVVDGRLRMFDYKLLNVLIQGSAADCTKEAIVNYDKNKVNGDVLLAVHDELLVSTSGDWKKEMERLRESMECVKFDVPMLTDGKALGKTWARLKPVK